MQTCVGSVAGLAFTGGFGSYLIAMDKQSYLNLGNTKGNSPNVRASAPCAPLSLRAWGLGFLPPACQGEGSYCPLQNNATRKGHAWWWHMVCRWLMCKLVRHEGFYFLAA